MRTATCPVCGGAFRPDVRRDRIQVCCSKPCSGLYRRRPLRERFEEKVERSDGCWTWTGATNGCGYGVIGAPGSPTTRKGPQNLYAHRVSYELNVGSIPDGFEIDHLCENTLCVRPDHLQPVPPVQNALRRPSTKWTDAEVDDCRQLADQGFGIEEIASLTGIPEGTVGRYLAGWSRTVPLVPRPSLAAA